MDAVRYAVVGLGHIAQAAVLPAFEHARRNSRLVAFVSGDPVKRERLPPRYGVEHVYDYDQYDVCLGSGLVDAVYIALPNSEHYRYAKRAIDRGVHVLCEKPLATTAQDAEDLQRSAAEAGVKLMTAYRLHFERANLEAIEIARSGRLGELRFFNSSFSLQVREGNARTRRDLGGGPLYDLGVYCINAARSLFGDSPTEAFAFSSGGADRRFAQVDEMTSAALRFPRGRLALFNCSFGASPVTWYEVVGTEGSMRLENSYEYAEPITLQVKVGGRTERRTYGRRDQFAPELLYFSDCVLRGREPEPDAREGLLDLKVIEALRESARTRRPVFLELERRRRHPGLRQEARRPPPRRVPLVHARSGSRD